MTRTAKSARGISAEEARAFVLQLDGVTSGRAYGHPSLLIAGKFFARFRDDDTVLVLHLGSLEDREVLMEMEPRAFFFTEHYRNYPAVLIRLAEVPQGLFGDVVTQAWRVVRAARSAKEAKKARKTPPRRRRGL